jgi:hypothetical protein
MYKVRRTLTGKTFKKCPFERNGKIILIHILDTQIMKLEGEWENSGSCSKVGIDISVIESYGSATIARNNYSQAELTHIM